MGDAAAAQRLCRPETQKGFLRRDVIGIEAHKGIRRVMLGEHPRGLHCIRCFGKLLTEHAFDVLAGDAAGTQEAHRFSRQACDDGRFNADRRGPIVENERNFARKILHHMLRVCRGDAPRRIGRGRDDRCSEFVQEFLRHGVRRHAQSDRCKSRAGKLMHRTIVGAGHHKRQRAGPKGSAELQRPRIEISDLLRLVERRDMGDQRIETWSAFGGENLGHRDAVPCIRSKPVDGFGREGDEAA